MINLCPIHKRPFVRGICGPCRKESALKPAQTPPVAVMPEPAATDQPKSAAAVRGQRYRERQKQLDPAFNKKEAERKQQEREKDKQDPKKFSKKHSGFPLSLAVLRRMVPLFVMTNAPPNKGILVTGGYDSTKQEAVQAAHDKAEHGGRVTPPGWGSHQIENTPTNNLPLEFEDSFAPTFVRSREVKAMLNFIREVTRTSPMMVCEMCDEQIALELDFEVGFNHLHERHPAAFQRMLERIQRTNKRRCPNDHAGMAERHASGVTKLYCGRCRKLLYKPPKQKRSDTPNKLPEAA